MIILLVFIHEKNIFFHFIDQTFKAQNGFLKIKIKARDAINFPTSQDSFLYF